MKELSPKQKIRLTDPRKLRTGYRLHTDRLLHTGKEGMRSFKFPLKNKNQTEYNLFIEKVQRDYITQVGLLNLTDWLSAQESKKDTYSIADFWLDSLRAGVIFSHKDAEIKALIQKINKQEPKNILFRKKLEAIEPELFEVVDPDKLYEFFISNKRPGDKTPQEIFLSNRNTLFPSLKNKENDLVDKWTRELSKLSNSEKSQYVAHKFNISLSTDFEYSNTFFIHPKLIFTPDLGAKDLLTKYRDFLQQENKLYSGKDFTENLEMILGFYNNHGAFSKYFNATLKLLRDNPEQIIREVLVVCPAWTDSEVELRKRLEFLHVQSKKLQDTELAKPHEYLSSFGGKFQSWVSNTLRQEEEIKRQLYGAPLEQKPTKGCIDELHAIISSESKIDNDAVSDESRRLAKDCLDLIQRSVGDVPSDSELSIFRDLVGDLRSKLNVEFQDTYHDIIGRTEKEKKKYMNEHRANGRYPRLFTDIKLVPNFLGETKKENYLKFLNSAEILVKSIEYIEKFDKQILSTFSIQLNDKELLEFIQKKYEFLRSKYYVLNSTRFKHRVEAVLNKLTVKDQIGPKEDRKIRSINDLFVKTQNEYINQDYFSFYIHPLAKRRQRTEIVIDIDVQDIPRILLALTAELKPRWDDIINSNDFGEILDAVEIEKFRLGILSMLFTEHEFLTNRELLESKFFINAHTYLDFVQNPRKLTGLEMGEFLQRFVLAEAKGAVSKMTRTEYTERYVVQPMNTEKEFPLIFNKKTKQWSIASSEYKRKSIDSELIQKVGKDFSGDEEFQSVSYPRENMFDLITSKYHIQFLSKTVRDVDGKSWWDRNGVDFSLASYSFILERKVAIKWDLKTRTVSIQRSDLKEDTNVFVSIPFNISPKQKPDLKTDTRYMGVDVGEYGLAWTIIEVDLNKKVVSKIVKQGFIYEPLTHKVREYVQTIKNAQTKGTFGVPDTKLARIRENAITSLRNQVHAIALQHNAKPVYEFEISNFETGSNRVKVIYDSVKRADTGRGGSDAEKSEVDLIWGKSSKNFGSQIGAYATSYICTNCGYSPYLEFEQTKDAQEVLAKQKLMAEKFLTRPSLKDFLNTTTNFSDRDKFDLNNLNSSLWKIRRGNSAIYACQNCKHISDADIQASYWIALKRFIKDLTDIDDKKDKQIEIKTLVELHKSSKVRSTDLKLELK